jgi:hypothetical protein
MLRSFDGAVLGSPVSVTTEPAAQFHSAVTVDRQDRVWVAWDEAGPNWGKDYSSSSAAPGAEGLHARRSLGIRVTPTAAFRNQRQTCRKSLPGE